MSDRLPIELIPNTRPPMFRWRSRLDIVSGSRDIVMEGTLPSGVDTAVVQVLSLLKERQAFKDWVHKYLDDHGVPTNPPGSHGASGCRIGDRMDWLMSKLKEAEAENASLRKQLESPSPVPAGDLAYKPPVVSSRRGKGG